MKQTAVQFLWDMLSKGEFINDPEELFNQAKAMEKEQIMDAYTADCDTLGYTNSFKQIAEQYYNKTFKSE